MNRYILLALLWVASASAVAQDAAAIAAQREAEERERRMTANLERLQEANNVQQRRINELSTTVADLQRQLVQMENRFKNSQLVAVTSADIRKVYDKMAEIEKNRQADNNLVKEQFVELKKILDKPPVIVTPPAPAPRDNHTTRNDSKRDVTPLPEDPPAFTGEYYPYTIKSGDRLLQIIAAFNAQLKEKGKAPITLDQVKKANPKINPNNLIVGKEIRIPIPPDK